MQYQYGKKTIENQHIIENGKEDKLTDILKLGFGELATQWAIDAEPGS